MAYRSNLKEMPELIRALLAEKLAWQVEVRNTFDMPQIPAAFREEEYLSSAEWAWLNEALQGFSQDKALLLLPPGGKGYDLEDRAAAAAKRALARPHEVDAPDEAVLRPTAPDTAADENRQEWEISEGPVSRPFNLRIMWDGTLTVASEPVQNPGEPPRQKIYFASNINELEDPLATLLALS